MTVMLEDYYHDAHCNASRYWPQGCPMCSCWQPRAEKAEAKLKTLQAAYDQLASDYDYNNRTEELNDDLEEEVKRLKHVLVSIRCQHGLELEAIDEALEDKV